MRAVLEEASEQALRGGQIIQRLRDLVTRGETEKQIETLPALIEEASSLALVGAAALGTSVSFRFDPRASTIIADRIQIQQVLINLIRNAAEAMGSMKRRELVVTTKFVDAETVEVAVADRGPGLPKVMADELFQPFVSTKRDGMGLGLLICRSIVEAHGGRTLERGKSRRRNYFPLLAHVQLGSWRVERWLTAQCMSSMTTRLFAGRSSVCWTPPAFTLSRTSPPAAFLNAASGLSAGCVLLDIRMPGVDGLEVQARLNRLRVNLPVIVMTGHGDVPSAVRAMKAGAVDFLEKPFDDETLLHAIGGVRKGQPAHRRSRRQNGRPSA